MKTTLKESAKKKTRDHIAQLSEAIQAAENSFSEWNNQAEAFRKQKDLKFELAKFMADRYAEKVQELKARKEKAVTDSAAFFKEIAIDGTGEIGFYFLNVEPLPEEKQVRQEEG
jgi:hypothetical protein